MLQARLRRDGGFAGHAATSKPRVSDTTKPRVSDTIMLEAGAAELLQLHGAGNAVVGMAKGVEQRLAQRNLG